MRMEVVVALVLPQAPGLLLLLVELLAQEVPLALQLLLLSTTGGHRPARAPCPTSRSSSSGMR